MAREVTIVVPIEEGQGTKLVAVDAKVSEGTINHNGGEYHVVQHTNSKFSYLADADLVEDIESDGLSEEMSELMTSENF